MGLPGAICDRTRPAQWSSPEGPSTCLGWHFLDCKDRRCLGQGPGLPAYPTQGAKGGATQFTLTVNEMPSHNHVGTMRASNLAGDTANPNDNSLATTGSDKIYHTGAPAVNMDVGTVVVGNTGGSFPVNKVSPYLVMRWCVAMVGVFPSRN